MNIAQLLHFEKAGNLMYYLEYAGLAKKIDSQWYEVESYTAYHYMCYLAGFLGQHPDVNMNPGTDSPIYLKNFLPNFKTPIYRGEVDILRTEFLDNTLPIPSKNLDIIEIVKFKRRYNKELQEFRIKVENCIIDILNISDMDDRLYKKELKMKEMQSEKNELIEKMKSFKLPGITFGMLLAVGSEIAGATDLLTNTGTQIGVTLGLTGAIYSAAKEAFGDRYQNQGPLAYAALAERKWR